MDVLRDRAVSAIVAAGLVSGLLVAVRGRAPREGLRCLLDFLVAAGVIRLATVHTWTAVLVAGATLAVRQIAGRGMQAGALARAPADPPG